MSEPSHNLDAIIVGAGFSGLCVAIRMQQAGLRYLVLEAASTLGGTWRDNRYPGAACDVPASLYSYSFAPNPDWARAYPRQDEIERYLNDCADRFGVRAGIRFDCPVRAAHFEVRDNRWRVVVGDGGETLHARSLVLATGGLSRPRMPAIDGLHSFAGPVFHSARWRADVDLHGKRVGVIGCGASAIQIVPAIAPEVAQLTLFQRTPSWIVSKFDPVVSAWRRSAYRRMPWLQRLARACTYARLETRALAFTRWPWLLKLAKPLVTGYRFVQVRDPALRRQLTPDYVMGCKRVLPTNAFHHALGRNNVSLVSAAITRITPHGIVDANGREHALDAIVTCTGFHAAEAGAPFPLHGLDARELNAFWGARASAYLGTTVGGFPNLFIMIGPNTALGHSSMIYIIEAQTRYVLDALRTLAARPGAAVDVHASVQARYNSDLQSRLARTVWNTGGCTSWYLTRAGLNTTMWPDFTFVFRWRTRRFDAENYRWLSRAPDAVRATTQ